jgi:hypothetical protein
MGERAGERWSLKLKNIRPLACNAAPNPTIRLTRSIRPIIPTGTLLTSLCPLLSPPSFPTSVGSGKLSGGHLNIMLESSHGNFGLDGFGDEALLVRQVM